MKREIIYFRKFLFVISIILFGNLSPISASPADTTKDKAARTLIESAVIAMGGEKQLRGIRTLKISGISHQNFLEQSERPEGPWLVSYEQFSEIRDVENQRSRMTTEARNFQIPAGLGMTLIIADGVVATEVRGQLYPGTPSQWKEFVRESALAPERILLTALDAPDLRPDKNVILQNVPHKVVKFTWNTIPITLYINADTNLPTAVETVQSFPSEFFWGVWGDVTTRTVYSFWTLEKGGIHYPLQRDVFRNNQHLQTTTFLKLTINSEIPAQSFSISDDVKTKFQSAKAPDLINNLPLGRTDRPAQEIAPGIINIPGIWNATLIKQPDGIIILEAPISSGYSAKVMAEAERRFPNSKIKGVITTSDAFPHLGGVREYVARNIPVYALDLNRPILERLINAPFSINPDALAKTPRKPKFNIISGKTILGSGANRLEIYPIRTETGERMMMVYFPEYKLLYGSDLVQKQAPQNLSELMNAVTRENLAVENVFAMHAVKTPWSEIKTAVGKLY